MSDELNTSAAVASYLQSRRPEEAVRTSMTLAAGVNPDEEAEYKRLARASGIPVDSVRDNKQAVQQRVTAPDYNDLAVKFPSTTQYLSTLENARIAHDDVGNLSGVEKAIRGFMDGGQFKKEARQVPGFLLEAGKQAAMGATAGLGAGIMDVAAVPLDLISSVTRGILPQDIPGALAQTYRQSAQRARGAMDFFSAPAEGNIAKGIMSGMRSAGQNIALLPLGVAGGAEAMVGSMASMVGAQAYGDARERGMAPTGAMTYAIPQAAFEYAFEKLPASRLLEDIAKHSSLGTMVARQLAPEVLGEQATTVLQDLNQWVRLNPTKTVAEFIAERPDAAAQTLVATLVGIGVQGGAVRGIQRVVGGMAEREAQAQRAEASATRAQEFAGLVEQSKLRQRDPEAFAQFVAEVADSGETPSEFYIDAEQLANTLNQSAITIEQLRAFAPAVADQMEAARMVPGADIRVPVAEFAAAPQDITAALIDHLRENPESMSRAEAQAFTKEQGPRIQAEVERTLADETMRSETQQAIDQVRRDFEGQLNAAGKFRPEVNAAYASMLAGFYGTQAQRAGLPVDEFMQRYRLNVTSKEGTGRQRLEQGMAAAEAAQAVDTLKANGLGRLQLVETEADLPASGQRKILSEGVQGVRGLYDPATDTTYLVRANLGSMDDAFFVGLHEAFHRGLRKSFPAVEPILTMIHDGNERVQRQTAAYMETHKVDRLEAIEEVLADMAGQGQAGNLKGWDKLLAFLRDIVTKLASAMGVKVDVTDQMLTDIVAGLRGAGMQDEVQVLNQPAYHGSPHDFDIFSTDAIGTGEGAQAYGYGLYFAENKSIAEHYQRVLSGDGYGIVKIDGRQQHNDPEHGNMMVLEVDDRPAKTLRGKEGYAHMRASLQQWAGNEYVPGQQARLALDWLAEAEAAGKIIEVPGRDQQGRLYQVEIPDEVVARMLLWDKPLSEQPEAVRAGLAKLAADYGYGYPDTYTGAEAYKALTSDVNAEGINGERGAQQAASEMLESVGVQGVKYMDGQSRNRPLKEIKREFLEQLPEDADFDEVLDLVGTGQFSPTNDAILNALAANDWLGFDYPAQAISAALSDKLADFDASAELVQAVEAAREGATFNFVVFNDKNVQLTHKDGSPVTKAERAEFFQGQQQGPRGSLSFSPDITAAPSVIALLEGADLSTFIHESGHFFLEVQADLAARIQTQISSGESVSDAERAMVTDFNRILTWFGVTADAQGSALDRWAQMSLEERREHHETWARGFERYVMEGKAPSQELQGLFAKFRAWLVSVYKTLKGLNVTLTDDVRQVMDRMLATDEAIAEAEAARNMGPLFASPDQAGMTPKEYAEYQALGARATAAADSELGARLMKDMKWLSRARDKAMKAAQAEAAELRREVEREVRADVMSTSVYRAWAFLTGKLDRVDGAPKAKPAGEDVDNLFTAIAKLGGLDRAEVKKQWGLDAKEKLDSGVFGSPVVRKEGGLSIDAMAERLVEAGYLLPDENGKADLAKFEALFDDQRRGIDRFSIRKQYAGEQDVQAMELPEVAAGRLNTDELKRMYGEEADAKWRLLSERRMTSPKGLDPEQVAVTFGFTSADHLVNTLVRTPPPEQVIEEMVDQQMLQRYGDITSEEALQRAADEAVHNEVRARVVATELKALEKAGTVRTGARSTVDAMARAAKYYAYQIIARQRVRDLRPTQYAAAQARSARLAAQALGKSTDEAAMHKRNELINGYATKAAYDAQDEVKALQKYFRKFDKRLDSIDPEYQDQIDQLLERFDFKPASLKAIDKRKAFAAWYAEQEAAGNAPNVPEELLGEAGRQSFKDMTVEELRGLRDTIKQIEHQGRLKKKLLLARDKRDFDAIAIQIADTITENGGNVRPLQLEGPNPVMDWFAGVWASHRKLASLFRQMDGNKDSGPLFEFLGRPMNERATMEDVMIERATMALRELYEPLTKLRGGITGYRSKLFIPEINASLTRGGRLAVALNWGNEANRQRLMDGDKWTEGQVRAVMRTLTVPELEFVNKVWEYLDSYWPEIAAKEKRLTGVEPEKVEAVPFTVMAADGTEVQMRGGYYPLKYDTDRSDRADQQEAAQAAKEMMQGVFSKATTRRGHTKERLKEVKRAVRKDLNVITQHVTQVVHDLAWHEWLIDTNKLMGDERIVNAIRDHYGPKVLKSMREDVLGIATADVVPMTDVDKALMTLRGNVTRATMGASVTTAFLQPFGLTQSIVRIGGRHVLRGLARWGGDAARMESAISWIHDRSEFMRLRAKTFNRELREIRGTVQGKSAIMRAVDGGLFYLMQKMQMVADVPTWLGQYEKSTAEGLSEADAVAMADRAVMESQGGGGAKDMAEIQRKYPLLTQFYSYFNVTLNLAVEQTAATDFKNPRAVAGWLGDMALLMMIPAILPSFILYALRGGDDDDEKELLKKVAGWQISYLLGTMVGARELTSAVGGFDYAGPPVGRVIVDIGRAGKQTEQGEIDEPLVYSYINLLGTVFGIPTVQALRSYKGWKAWDEGEDGAGPQSVLMGPPPKD